MYPSEISNFHYIEGEEYNNSNGSNLLYFMILFRLSEYDIYGCDDFKAGV